MNLHTKWENQQPGTLRFQSQAVLVAPVYFAEHNSER
jgi:hypothetical protein